MAIGADVGGSRIKFVRLADNEVVWRGQVDVKRAWPELLANELFSLAGPEEPIGVGIAGLVDHHRGILRWAPHLDGVDVPIGAELSARLGRRVAVDNDANCATRAEATSLAQDPVLVVMLGTGIGAGLWTGGDVYRGRSFAGEVGHMTIEPDGRVCRCGRLGCWETRISSWRLAEVGTSPAQLQDAGIWLGRGLFNLITILDPAVIVVGGGVTAEHGDEILPAALDEIARLSDIHRQPPPIVASRHGIWAGAIGAALLAQKDSQALS
ncbi:MAG: ROK family protein [Acidimicrobiia bacterium]